MEQRLFYIASDDTKTKSHYYLRHVRLLQKLLNEDRSEEAEELLAGLNFVITGDESYLLLEKERK
jgi:hypothetical protein